MRKGMKRQWIHRALALVMALLLVQAVPLGAVSARAEKMEGQTASAPVETAPSEYQEPESTETSAPQTAQQTEDSNIFWDWVVPILMIVTGVAIFCVLGVQQRKAHKGQ